jgi:hypothetical protein
MSETYQSKQERRQRLLESLPEELRPHVSVRNIEAVAGLSSQAQARLLEAVQAGLKRLPRAIEQLRADPDTSVADLLNSTVPPDSELPAPQIPTNTRKEIADLIQECFPDMPRVSAEALAEADVMRVTRVVAQAHQELFRSKHIQTDFVMLTLYGLMRKTLEGLEELIVNTPALRQAFNQGDLPWKCRHSATATHNK